MYWLFDEWCEMVDAALPACGIPAERKEVNPKPPDNPDQERRKAA